MYLTGFTDEAAQDMDGQIRATKELGWDCIESRNVDGTNIHDLPEDKFDAVCRGLADAGVRVNCFGSRIANWQKSIFDAFDETLEETRRAIPRMRRLGTRLIRIMSYPPLKDRAPDDQMEDERFRRLREIVALFRGEGLWPVHENCMNYGGMGPSFTLKMLDAVPGLDLVFDTGNPVFTPDYAKPEPRPMQSAWDFYSQVRERVVYIHVKDGVWHADSKTTEYTWAGEGQGHVRRILKDALDRGYDGGISIEPHLKAVAHDASIEAAAEARFEAYVEYGRRLMRLLAEIGHPTHGRE